MDAGQAIFDKYVYDFKKRASSEAEILTSRIIDALLRNLGADIADDINMLRHHYRRIDALNDLPRISVVYESMPTGVLLMCFGDNGTFARLLNDGTVEHGAVKFTAKGTPCSTPTNSSTPKKVRAAKKSKRRSEK